MVSAFSYDENNKINILRLVETIKDKNPKNIDEIVSALKEYRLEIVLEIESLSEIKPITADIEKKIALLIRQEQYIDAILNKQKTELAEIFGEIKNNCIVPEILNWYHPPEE